MVNSSWNNLQHLCFFLKSFSLHNFSEKKITSRLPSFKICFKYLVTWYSKGYWVTWAICKVIKLKFFSTCWTEVWHKLEFPIFDSTFHSLGFTYPQLCSKSRDIPGISFKVCPILNSRMIPTLFFLAQASTI